MMARIWVFSFLSALFAATVSLGAETSFRAGAFAQDITPTKFPVIVNGMFEERTANSAHDPLHARCLVLDDGKTRLAIVVVDSCGMGRELLDEAKAIASKATSIPTDRMLISSTHTHSAPSVWPALGSRPDPEYATFLPVQIAKGIEQAAKNLAPARAGWAVAQDYEHTHCRRWIRRPDKMFADPFGAVNVRAHMHPGYQNPDVIGPSGPVDPDITMLSVQTPDGKPVALLANYSQHYYDAPLISADYYGVFANKIGELIGADKSFVGIMSQGTSGDQMWMDYGAPAKNPGLQAYGESVAKVAFDAYKQIEYRSDITLAMSEKKITLPRRLPDEKRLAWAKDIAAKLGDRLPRNLPEIYALEAIHLHDEPERELKLQAVRIGDLGITAIPNEVFAITGLKLKAQSPLHPTFNIGLANGVEGYIPPPEQHKLGGYTTWPARSAGLEEQAEPKIVATLLTMLEEVSGKPRREILDRLNPYVEAVLNSKPIAYWRLNGISGPTTLSGGGKNIVGTFEDGVAFYLDGPLVTVQWPKRGGGGLGNERDAYSRATHFAGGRMKASVPKLGDTYSVEMWFWNGLPHNARPVTGYMFSRGPDGDKNATGDHLGIGGTFGSPGKLIFFNGNKLNQVLTGNTDIALKSWNHVALVRAGKSITVYLNGNIAPDISGEAEIGFAAGVEDLFVGGRNDNFANFEGRLSDAAVYARALKPDEVAAHYKASGLPPKPNTAGPTPTSPADSLKLLHVKEGFEIELVAAEPLVKDPIAIEWGTDGKLWVIEMADYPLGLDGKMKSGGRVRYLESTKGDGKYDKSTLFLDGVNFPTGIMPWRNGVIVTAAPDIFYAEDTDGDGKADVRTPLYTGFMPGNPQLRVNGLQWGLDGWLYCANGWSGGVAESVKTHTKVDIRGRDFRIKPDEEFIDAQSGQTEFGRNRDDWGNWFGCDNSNPLWHFALDDGYTRRNPHIAPPDPRKQLALPVNPRVFARSVPQKRYHSFEHSDRFTSACSAMIYRDDRLFPRGTAQHAFVCEPVHNLVQHLLVTEDGVSFTARRADDKQQTEFLSSEDPWFRPVNVRTGPDGALYVVDMYRFIIEHPEWLPPEGQKELAAYWRLGEDRGRIYRIFPKGKRPSPIPRLDKLNTPQLVAALDSPNGWQRDTAQRLLAWRRDAAAVAPLEKMTHTSKNPLARLQALCTLDLVDALTDATVERALTDAHPAVRRHAVRLAEPRAKNSPPIIAAALKLVDDPDAKVKMQLVYTLGAWNDARVGPALATLARTLPSDPYFRAAVISSVNATNVKGVTAAVLGENKQHAMPPELFLPLLSLTATMADETFVAETLAAVAKPQGDSFADWQYGAVAAMLDAWQRRGKSAPETVKPIEQAAQRVALDMSAAEPQRAAAMRLLKDVSALGGLLLPQTPTSVQAAAIAQLARLNGKQIADLMLSGWASHSPAVRSEILSAVFTREEWVVALLDNLENGHVPPGDLNAATAQRLTQHGNAAIRERAAKLNAIASDPDRAKVLEQFQAAATLSGDRTRGAAVFAKKCAVCHKLGDVGKEVGPSLAAVTDKSPQTLLISILDPSRVVDAKYKNYIVRTKDGRIFTGILASESGNSITLMEQEGKLTTVLRTDLQDFKASEKSLMPDGLEKDLTAQDLADLMAFVAGGK